MHVQVSAPGLILVIWVFTLVEYRTPEYNAGQVTNYLLSPVSSHPSHPSACNNHPSARNNHPSVHILLCAATRLFAIPHNLHFELSTASDNTVSPQYAYPAWCHVLGWAITLTSLAALPILAVTEIFRWMLRGNKKENISLRCAGRSLVRECGRNSCTPGSPRSCTARAAAPSWTSPSARTRTAPSPGSWTPRRRTAATAARAAARTTARPRQRSRSWCSEPLSPL